MKIINEIKSIKNSVKSLLENYPHLRDSDLKLTANIWYSQLSNKNITAIEFLKEVSEGNLIDPQSISRCRRKIQEQNPELRGNYYNVRQVLENEMRSNVNNL